MPNIFSGFQFPYPQPPHGTAGREGKLTAQEESVKTFVLMKHCSFEL